MFLDESLQHPVPLHANPTDHALDLINTDFLPGAESRIAHISDYAERWQTWSAANGLAELFGKRESDEMSRESHGSVGRPRRVPSGAWSGIRNGVHRTGILMERNAINYSRNLLAYGVRAGMYSEFRRSFRHV